MSDNIAKTRNLRNTWLIMSTCFLFLVMGAIAKAAHTTFPGDLSLSIQDTAVVERGTALFSEKCSACHGGEGRGGRAPCLTCGKFARSGNTNDGIFSTISSGIPMTKMGAFGSTVSTEDIVSLVTYLRWKENQRIESGEITRPTFAQEKPLEFPKN